MTCEWCGHDHAREQLCSARPKWNRRGFLALFGVGIAGLALAPSLSLARPAIELGTRVFDSAGRAFRYMRAGATALAPGTLVMQSPPELFDSIRPVAINGGYFCGVANDAIAAGQCGWVQTQGPTTITPTVYIVGSVPVLMRSHYAVTDPKRLPV